MSVVVVVFFFSSRRRHTIGGRDWSSDVCSSDLPVPTRSAAWCARSSSRSTARVRVWSWWSGPRADKPSRQPEGHVRLAAIDVGTNSTRLLVADVDGGGITAEQAREMVITRLGRGVDRTRRLDPAALRRTLEVLADYAAICERLGVRATRVVATSATRDASNREEFLDGVRRLLGVEAEVLSGDEEGATAYAGATHDLPGDERTLVVDIGGGSTEFIIGNHDPDAMLSIDVGCVRLFERHLASDPPTATEVAALRRDAQAHLGEVRRVLEPGSASRVIGVAGTVTTVT